MLTIGTYVAGWIAPSDQSAVLLNDGLPLVASTDAKSVNLVGVHPLALPCVKHCLIPSRKSTKLFVFPLGHGRTSTETS